MTLCKVLLAKWPAQVCWTRLLPHGGFGRSVRPPALSIRGSYVTIGPAIPRARSVFALIKHLLLAGGRKAATTPGFVLNPFYALCFFWSEKRDHLARGIAAAAPVVVERNGWLSLFTSDPKCRAARSFVCPPVFFVSLPGEKRSLIHIVATKDSAVHSNGLAATNYVTNESAFISLLAPFWYSSNGHKRQTDSFPPITRISFARDLDRSSSPDRAPRKGKTQWLPQTLSAGAACLQNTHTSGQRSSTSGTLINQNR